MEGEKEITKKKDPGWLKDYKEQFEHPIELDEEDSLKAHAMLTCWQLKDLLRLVYDKKYEMASALTDCPDTCYSMILFDEIEQALRKALSDMGQQKCAYDLNWIEQWEKKYIKKNEKKKY